MFDFAEALLRFIRHQMLARYHWFWATWYDLVAQHHFNNNDARAYERAEVEYRYHAECFNEHRWFIIGPK